MNKQIQQGSKTQTFPQYQEEILDKSNVQYNTTKDMSLLITVGNQDKKIDRDYESSIELSRVGGKKEDNQKGDKKVIGKKSKYLVDNFSYFIPEFLILLNQQKCKAIIRIGRNYQADVPTKCTLSHIYRPLSHLKIWTAGEVTPSIMKKFREKFGQNRTQEDLCLLMYQYQCDWDQINNYITEYKGQLRKAFMQKDRTKV